jgi:hypothetical protein
VFPSEREHLALILRALPEFVIVLDMEGYVRYLNRPEPGSGLEDAVGRHAHEFTPPDSLALFDHHLAEMVRTGEVQEYDAEIVFPNGFRGWYRTRMLPLDMGEGERAILLISSNVTALRALETEVENLRRLLPICAWCGQIQNAESTWTTIEHYLHDTAGTQVSHGICPSCQERQFHGMDDPDGSGGPRGSGGSRGDVA